MPKRSVAGCYSVQVAIPSMSSNQDDQTVTKSQTVIGRWKGLEHCTGVVTEGKSGSGVFSSVPLLVTMISVVELHGVDWDDYDH